MEQTLLWVSLAVGIVLYFCRFLPHRGGAETSAFGQEGSADGLHPAARNIALSAPFVGLLLTLPSAGGVLFHEGQRLGMGFLFGGMATLLGCVDLLLPSRKKEPSIAPSPVLLTSSYGTSIIAVVLSLMFLRESLFDALMGVAIGGFCVTFVLFMGLSGEAQQNSRIGRRLAVAMGMTAVLSAAASLGIFRDPLTPELTKQTWSAVLVAFAAIGTLLVTGTQLLESGQGGKMGRIVPLVVLVSVGGLALYQMATKITNTAELALIGIGGLLLWPVALSVLREAKYRGGDTSATPVLSAPLLAVLVVTSGFLAALQSLQGVGVAVGTLALFLAYPATMNLAERSDAENNDDAPSPAIANGAAGLLLFGTLLLLWRLFATRWSGDLRGVLLTDQYALFGLLVGAALPGLLAAVPHRIRDGKTVASGGLIGAIAVCALLTLAAPAAVLVLFGAKSAVALMIGLALGAVPVLTGGASLLPGLLALGVALALNQFTGIVLPAETPTRAEKIRYLAVIMSGIVVAAILANRIGVGGAKDGTQTK